MNWVIYFFGSGAAFYSGIALIIAVAVFLSAYHGKWFTRVATLSVLLGLILIALSATPLSYWFYFAATLTSFVWLWAERSANLRLRSWQRLLRILVVCLWTTGTVAEVPYSFMPAFSAKVRSRLYIFADSVTAGMGENTTTTWPAILARSHAIEVHDYSQMGAKVASMARKAEGLSLGAGIVLLEIGGNDVLGGTPERDFERDLEKLLGTLAGEGRNIVMFELPLPPFYNEFGRVQRRLAAKYNVQLIPKSVFVGVLTADGATVDSVHLSAQGHELMAKTIWNIVRSAYNN